MQYREIEIINKLGLHARASARLTQLASKFKSEVWLSRNDRRVNAKSIMGVMMLATRGLTQGGDYHRLNALKNLLSMIIAAVAILVFVSGGVVAWLQALVMVPAVALGGYAGVWAVKRVPQTAVRLFVVAVGLFLAVYYFVTG